jgi:hypothetical protein
MKSLKTIIASLFIAVSSFAEPDIVDRVIEESAYTEGITEKESLKKLNIITLYEPSKTDKDLLRELPFLDGVFHSFNSNISKNENRIRRKFFFEGYDKNKFPFESELLSALRDYAVANNILGAEYLDNKIEKVQEAITITYKTKKGKRFRLRYQFQDFNKKRPGYLRLSGDDLRYIDNFQLKAGINQIALGTEKELLQFGDNSKFYFEVGYYKNKLFGEKCSKDIRLIIGFETSSLFFWENPENFKKYYRKVNN